MTRDTVEVGGSTVADVFHDADVDEPHLTLSVGGSELDVADEDAYADVAIDGYEKDFDDLDEFGEKYQRRYVVRQNGEVVSRGLVRGRSPTPVDVQLGGGYHVVVPANTPIEVDVRGEPADE